MSRLPTIENQDRQSYPSDLSDAEWAILKPLLPAPKGFGHPVEVDLREILNGIFYVQRTGCQWEMLPHDLPPYTTVYGYFQKSQRRGIWQLLHDQVRHRLRIELGRDEQSSVDKSRFSIGQDNRKKGWLVPGGNLQAAVATLRGGIRFRWWQEGAECTAALLPEVTSGFLRRLKGVSAILS